MRRFVLFVVMAALGATAAFARGRTPWPIPKIAIDPLSPSTLYAVVRVPPANGGLHPVTERIFRTDDGGGTWHPITTPKFDVLYPDGSRYVTAIAVDPQVQGIVYAAAGTGGAFVHSDIIWTELFKSIDRGESWTKILGTEASSVFSIAIDPSQSSQIYIGGSSIPGPGGIFKSVDGGANWFDVSPLIATSPGFSPAPDAFTMLGTDPSDPGVLYAGGGSTPIYRSSAEGFTWSSDAEGIPDYAFVSAFSIASVRSSTLYAGTYGQGVFASLDSGAHWTSVNSAIGTSSILSLAVDPRSDSVAYVGTPNGVFKTLDRGDVWARVGLSDAAIDTIVIDPSSADTVYVGTSLGAFKSTNGGASWALIDNGIQPESGVRPVSVSPVVPLRGRS